MVDIQFHPIAKEDIKDLYDYFAQFSLQFADSFIEGLFDCIEDLKSFPQMGSKYSENEKYRQLIYRDYRVLYEYQKKDDKIIIMIIVHCSRQLRF